MRSMTLENFENFLKQKKTRKPRSIKRQEYLHHLMYKKAGIFALLDE